jgi:hypothetical protein
MVCACLWLLSGGARAQAPEAAAPGGTAAPDASTEAASPAPLQGEAAAQGDTSPGAAAQTAPASGSVPAEASAEEAASLTEEELKALGFEVQEGHAEAAAVETDLHVFGFLDFSISKLIAEKDSQWRAFRPDKTSFYIGNFNLYLTKNLTKRFRTMGEVRFLYKPNGDIPLSNGVGTPTTSTNDYADFDRPQHWGGVEIERVYLELTAHQYLIIRAGQFLTPYGIWNTDHGSPTVISVQRPYVVGEALFPERQTGFELFGRWDATRDGTLGYHLTLSNGRGPIAEYRDLDSNKAVGGRIFWEQQQPLGMLRVGGSAYYGQNTDGAANFTLTPEGRVKPGEILYEQYNELSLALDAIWKYRGLLVQAEWISQQHVYTEGGRTARTNDILQTAIFPSDQMSWGLYGLIGYRLPWFGIMPYYVGQYLDDVTANGTRSQITNMQVGLNIRAIDVVVFKIEYSHAFFKRDLFGSNAPIRYFQAQAAWAF